MKKVQKLSDNVRKDNMMKVQKYKVKMASVTNVLDSLEEALDFSNTASKNESIGVIDEYDANSVAQDMKSELLCWSNKPDKGEGQDTPKLEKASQELPHFVLEEDPDKVDLDSLPISEETVEMETGPDTDLDSLDHVSQPLDEVVTQESVPMKYNPDAESTENYACETCGRTWKSVSNLKQHQTKCANDTVTCEDCQLTFKSETTLMNHQIKYKCGSQTFEYLAANFGGKICKLCGFTSTSSRKVNHNCKMMPMLRCNLCPYSTRVEQRMEIHKTSGHFDELVCTFCGYQATAKTGCDPKYILKRHIDAKHNEETTYFCDQCDFKDTNYTKLSSHITSRHRVFTCQECNKEEKNVYQLKQHALKVHAIGKIQCALCDFSASSKYLVEKHQRVEHLMSIFKCPQCSYIGESDYLLKKHTKQKHSGDPAFSCFQCSFRGTSKYKLAQHMEQNHSPDPSLSCSQCGFKGTSKYKLTQHMTIH